MKLKGRPGESGDEGVIDYKGLSLKAGVVLSGIVVLMSLDTLVSEFRESYGKQVKELNSDRGQGVDFYREKAVLAKRLAVRNRDLNKYDEALYFLDRAIKDDGVEDIRDVEMIWMRRGIYEELAIVYFLYAEDRMKSSYEDARRAIDVANALLDISNQDACLVKKLTSDSQSLDIKGLEMIECQNLD